MLKNGNPMFGYQFNGYWKDVGTVESLWKANMDLLDEDSLHLADHDWPILSKSALQCPHFVAGHAKLVNSLITEGCYIDGIVKHSIVSDGVTIEAGAEVYDSVILSGAKICKGARVYRSIIGENSVVGANAVIGADDGLDSYKSKYCSGGVSLVGTGVKVADGVKLIAESMVESDIEEAKL